MDTPPPQQSQRPGLSNLWWLILLALIIWNVWILWPRSQPEVDIPYSVFISQIKSGNVSSVSISGDEITGTFVNQVLWPPATPSATTSASTTGTPGPAITGTPEPTQAALAVPSVTPQDYSDFRTYFPGTVGDPTLIPLLESKSVDINVSQPPSPWLGILLSGGLPFLLLIGFMIWMGSRATRSQNGIFGFGRSKPRRYSEERPNVTFKDVAGIDEAKQELEEVIDFLRQPQKYHNLGARVPRGVLLVGPPGTGKTLLARAVAGEAGAPFFNISASEFVEMFVGVGASRVRDLFEQAKAVPPAIVYIDELDAVGRRRGAGLGNVNDEREQTLNQLLVEMDGFDEHQEVIVLASTNRPDVLDPALLRPGRFDRQVTVGLPDRSGREGILHIHTRSLSLASDVDLHLLAQTTTGFSGADLANLCNEAALTAARKSHKQVSMEDFEEALDRIILGAARTLLLNEHERKVVAYHESGHALAAWMTSNADPVHKVTIIPHGRALGVTEQLPGDDQYNYSREYLLARLTVMLGGRAAEEVAIGDITTGAENDLVEATRLARRMITRWGMGSLGNMALDTDEQQPFLGYELAQGRQYSEEMAARIDQNIESLLANLYEAVRDLLIQNRSKLDNLVEVLLKQETISREKLVEVLGPREMESEPENVLENI
jgi:cell division protease FtsH